LDNGSLLKSALTDELFLVSSQVICNGRGLKERTFLGFETRCLAQGEFGKVIGSLGLTDVSQLLDVNIDIGVLGGDKGLGSAWVVR